MTSLGPCISAIPRRWKGLPVLVSAFILGPWISPSVAQQEAQQPSAPISSDSLMASAALPTEAPRSPTLAVDSVDPGRAGLGERIRVTVEGLSEAVETDSIDPRAFVLHLAGRPLPGLSPVGVDLPQDVLTFELRRTESSKQAWNALLGSPDGFVDSVRVGVGLQEGPELPPVDRDRPVVLALTILRPWWSIVMGALLVFALIAFVYYTPRTNLIRDSVPPQPPPGKMRPYSLARLQMAVWFFIIFGSFAFVYAITGEYNNIITSQALILMGIGIGTALGSSSIDHSKEASVRARIHSLGAKQARLLAEIENLPSRIEKKDLNDSERAALQADLEEKRVQSRHLGSDLTREQSNLSKPISESFLSDLVTDANGISLHRFQMLVWTVILVFLFGHGVYTNLAMPELDTTLLALMGISSGTYLGFKIPERQVEGT